MKRGDVVYVVAGALALAVVVLILGGSKIIAAARALTSKPRASPTPSPTQPKSSGTPDVSVQPSSTTVPLTTAQVVAIEMNPGLATLGLKPEQAQAELAQANIANITANIQLTQTSIADRTRAVNSLLAQVGASLPADPTVDQVRALKVMWFAQTGNDPADYPRNPFDQLIADLQILQSYQSQLAYWQAQAQAS